MSDFIRGESEGRKMELRKNHTASQSVRLKTDGAHKGMTIIDPRGDDLEAFRQSCYHRFGVTRVICVKPSKMTSDEYQGRSASAAVDPDEGEFTPVWTPVQSRNRG